MMLHMTKQGLCPINARQQAYLGRNRDVLDFGYGISFSYSSIKKIEAKTTKSTTLIRMAAKIACSLPSSLKD